MKLIPIYIINFILLVLSTQTVDFVALNNVHVILFLIPLFYWTIHAPTILPLWFIFLGGLAIDFNVDSLLGLHAFVFVVYYIVLHRLRRIILPQPMLYHFVIFAFSVTIFEIMRWFVMSLLTWQLVEIFPSILGVIMNIVAFFPIILVLKLVERVLSGHEKRRQPF